MTELRSPSAEQAPSRLRTSRLARMRAARFHRVGDPFVIETIDTPSPRPGDVLIQVHACGLVPNTMNSLDPPPMVQPPPLPAVYGLDPAGVVVEVGSSVHGIDIGDRVYANPLRYCQSILRSEVFPPLSRKALPLPLQTLYAGSCRKQHTPHAPTMHLRARQLPGRDRVVGLAR